MTGLARKAERCCAGRLSFRRQAAGGQSEILAARRNPIDCVKVPFIDNSGAWGYDFKHQQVTEGYSEMRKLILAALLSGLAAGAAPAIAAEANYKSEDVVSFLLDAAKVGETRGICVGTPQECATTAPAGFDVSVTFEKNSSILTPDAVTKLHQVALALTDPRLVGAKFAIDGYTDASGSDAYNQVLSDMRAKSVASYLVQQGVEADRLVAMGLGETSPRMPDPMDPMNRRVELSLQ